MKKTIKTVVPTLLATLLLASCNKIVDKIIEKGLSTNENATGFTQYTIRKGAQYCDQSTFKPIQTSDMKFTVRFDSSAIYQTKDPSNQYDINKLYGFSDNNSDHHQYSARFGWRWSDGALRLFAYVYNKGEVSSKELCTIPIGKDVHCGILVTSDSYVFTVNDSSTPMPRLSTTTGAAGYQLYPYFGGDESAPHDISIWIEKEK